MLSGGFDFSWASPSIRTNARRDTAVGARGLAFLQRWYRPDVDATDPLISPVFGDFTGLPPLLFQTGHTEVLRDDWCGPTERARAAGVPVRLEVFPLVPHAWHQQDLASRDPRRAAANRAVRQRHPPTQEHLVSIDQLSPSGTEALDVRNPATGEVVGRVAVQPAETVAALVDELRTHQSSWEALGPDARAVWLRKLRNWLLDNESRLIDVLAAETGKPRAEARFEVMVTCDAINYYADRARKFLAEKKFRPHGPLTATKKLTRVYRPYPVVGVITPWNFPLLIPGCRRRCGAAGRRPPSSSSPRRSLRCPPANSLRGWEQIGAPPVFACVTGLGATGAAVVDAVDMVQFTGSTRTGRAIAARAGERLIPCGVELGGKDPAIVLADADLSHAANGIAWGASNARCQSASSLERPDAAHAFPCLGEQLQQDLVLRAETTSVRRRRRWRRAADFSKPPVYKTRPPEWADGRPPTSLPPSLELQK